MKKLILLLMILLATHFSFAQLNRYVIQFKNKGSNTFTLANPLAYLSQKAIDRRTAYHIAVDSFDLPITTRYIDSVRLSGNVTILNRSKWLNQISIFTTDANALNKINALPFVASVNTIAARTATQMNAKKEKFIIENTILPIVNQQRSQATQNVLNYGTTLNEIALHNGQFLHNIGLRGQNMIVAVLDAGFFQYKTLSSFDSMNLNNQVLQTWDFVANETSVVEDNSHGMSCLSTITGNIPGTFVGTSPKANVVLYRTEDVMSEYPIEEFNWVCGLEKADSIGAQIASTSLGYTTFDNSNFDHTYTKMNGRTTTAAKGGTIAHRKGLLLFSANGNDGNSGWKFLSTPADIDSTIAVGAVNATGNVGSFSSYGPAADGRIKPEAAAVGVSAFVQNTNNTVGAGNGTSYACPKLAGLGTCLWQGFHEFNNYTIREAIIKSGSIYNNPNDRIGYGIPDMKKAFVWLLNKYASITSASVNACKTSITFKSKDVSSMKYEIERMLPGETNYTKIADIQGTGTVLANKNITTTDTLINIQPGTIKYRIKQIIDTTSASFTAIYLDSTSINLTSACVTTSVNPVTFTTEQITILPNPAKNNFTVKVNTSYAVKNLFIQITDMKGSTVLNLSQSKLAGVATFNIPIHLLSSGTYVVSVYDANKIIGSQKLLKQ